MRRRLLIHVVFALALILPSVASATTVQRLSLEDMTRKANSIVSGRIKSARTYWSGKVILTTYTMEVSETIKGASSRSVELTVVGGSAGGTTLHVSGMPAFRTGEDAIVFVERSGPYSTVVGLNQGKFTVAQGEVSNSVSGLTFPDGRRGQPLAMPVETFKKHLKLIIDRQP